MIPIPTAMLDMLVSRLFSALTLDTSAARVLTADGHRRHEHSITCLHRVGDLLLRGVSDRVSLVSSKEDLKFCRLRGSQY